MSNKLLKNINPIYTDFYKSMDRDSSSRQDAGDIAQASVERLLKLPAEQEVRSPAGLLRQIARNLKIDLARHRRRLPMESFRASTVWRITRLAPAWEFRPAW
ncbi:hypothetical protein TU85_11635 [Pseudomonas helleri]|nr:hypothetical protein TU85_11635 [Pseudomonas helleri]